MDKWIIIHPTHLLPNPFMTQPAHLPPLTTSEHIELETNHKWAKCNYPKMERHIPNHCTCFPIIHIAVQHQCGYPLKG